MSELIKRQQLLWRLLTEETEVQTMLRISREDDCLWICDMPRRVDATVCETAARRIKEAGFSVRLQESSRLWRIDLLPSDLIFGEPPAISMPADENHHLAYALYRMLYAHPAAWQLQPLQLLRALIKLTVRSHQESRVALAALFSQCAALLNHHQPLPSAACKILAQWICQEDEP